MPGMLLDIDPLSGTVETIECDESTGDFAIRRVGDVQPIIDRNKELLNHGEGCRDHQRGDLDMRLVASIPIEVVYLWLQKYGICAWKKDHWDKVKALLNDNEWRYLRTNSLVL